MSKIKLLVVDLDGTALKPGQVPYARFNDEFSAFLDNFVSHGGSWAINSTWDVYGQWDLVQCSALTSRPVFLMGEIGHQLAEIKDGALVMVEEYNKEVQDTVRQWGDRYWSALVGTVAKCCSIRNMHVYGHFMSCSVKPGQGEKARMAMEECIKVCDSAVVKCNDSEQTPGVSAYPDILSKGRSLAEVITRMGLRPDEVVAAGDETTDMSMMDVKLSAKPICPENAPQVVKDHVLSLGGVVGKGIAPDGVMDAFATLVKRQGGF